MYYYDYNLEPHTTIKKSIYDMKDNTIISQDIDDKVYYHTFKEIFDKYDFTTEELLKVKKLQKENLEDFIELYINEELDDYTKGYEVNTMIIGKYFTDLQRKIYPDYTDTQLRMYIKENY